MRNIRLRPTRIQHDLPGQVVGTRTDPLIDRFTGFQINRPHDAGVVLGHEQAARQVYDRAMKSVNKTRPFARPFARKWPRFRAEAEQLLGIAEKTTNEEETNPKLETKETTQGNGN